MRVATMSNNCIKSKCLITSLLLLTSLTACQIRTIAITYEDLTTSPTAITVTPEKNNDPDAEIGTGGWVENDKMDHVNLDDVLEGTGITDPINPTELPDVLPDEVYISNISGRRQHYPLGCETSAAIDLANYYGVLINEAEFQSKLPLSDNPDYGFVGSVTGHWGQAPPYAYGVHAAPVAALLQEYGINAQSEKNFSIDRIKSEIVKMQPVIAWVIGNCVGGVPHIYVDSEGREVTVAAYEHVVIVTGYSNINGTLRYLNNGKFYDIPVEVFETSWGVLGNMVVYIGE